MPVATQIKIHLIDFIVFGFVLNILSKLHQGQTTNRKKKQELLFTIPNYYQHQLKI